MYICNPSSFLVDLPPCKFLFCHEHWVHREGQTIHVAERVNNAVIEGRRLDDEAYETAMDYLDTLSR